MKRNSHRNATEIREYRTLSVLLVIWLITFYWQAKHNRHYFAQVCILNLNSFIFSWERKDIYVLRCIQTVFVFTEVCSKTLVLIYLRNPQCKCSILTRDFLTSKLWGTVSFFSFSELFSVFWLISTVLQTK